MPAKRELTKLRSPSLVLAQFAPIEHYSSSSTFLPNAENAPDNGHRPKATHGRYFAVIPASANKSYYLRSTTYCGLSVRSIAIGVGNNALDGDFLECGEMRCEGMM